MKQFDICVNDRYYEIFIGDKFYHNNYSTAKGHVIPDIMSIADIIPGFIIAKYENHAAYTNNRVLSNVILAQSNLNPDCKDPDWIFVRKEKENES